ncbi:hypothetical protein J6590_001903 [Homalodisca vitripennis]|nr:hypothetical protein J6590_001903 [Homalodisca vitripennis]
MGGGHLCLTGGPVRHYPARYSPVWTFSVENLRHKSRDVVSGLIISGVSFFDRNHLILLRDSSELGTL